MKISSGISGIEQDKVKRDINCAFSKHFECEEDRVNFVHDLFGEAECTCLSYSQPNNYGAFRKSLLPFNSSGLIANNVLLRKKTQMIDHALALASADTLSVTGSTSSVAVVPVVSVPIPSHPESPSSEAISRKEDFVEEKDWGITYRDLSLSKKKKGRRSTKKRKTLKGSLKTAAVRALERRKTGKSVEEVEELPTEEERETEQEVKGERVRFLFKGYHKGRV